MSAICTFLKTTHELETTECLSNAENQTSLYVGWCSADSWHFFLVVKKVKQSRNRPGVAQRVPGALGPQISRTFGT